MKYSSAKLTSLVIVIVLGFIVGYNYINHIKPANTILQRFTSLESLNRLGVYAIDTTNNQLISYRADERFAFCSTAKVIAVATLLKRSQSDFTIMNKHLKYSQKDVANSTYAPITKEHIVDGLNLSQLAKAAIEYSDNTAINLIIQMLGGTDIITQYARSLNDTKFRLDRTEPSLNTAIPGDKRDTTTPKAMAKSLQDILLESALEPLQRNKLLTWLKHNTTGDLRIRAGVPKSWVVADKTGTGDYGSTSVVGIIFPPKCAPIVLVIYFTQAKVDAKSRDDIIATVTHMVIKHFSATNKCLKSSLLI